MVNEMTVLREFARKLGLGDTLNWQWILVYLVCIAVLLLMLVVIYAFVKSFRFARDCVQKRNRGEQFKVPHTDPVEFYYSSWRVDHQQVCACLLEKQADAKLHDIAGPFELIEEKNISVNPGGYLPLLVHNGRLIGDASQIFAYMEKNFGGTPLSLKEGSDVDVVRHWYMGCPKTAQLTLGQAVSVLSSAVAVVADKFSLLDVFRLIIKSPHPAVYVHMIKRCMLRPFKPLKTVPHKQIGQAAFSSLAKIVTELESRLTGGREYIIDTLSVADLAIAVHFNRLEELGVLDSVMGDNSCVRAYWSRLKERKSLRLACHPLVRSKGSEEIMHCLALLGKEVGEKGAAAAFHLTGDIKDDSEEDEE